MKHNDKRIVTIFLICTVISCYPAKFEIKILFLLKQKIETLICGKIK